MNNFFKIIHKHGKSIRTVPILVGYMALSVVFACLLLICKPKTGYRSTDIGDSAKNGTIATTAGATKIVRDSNGYWYVVVEDNAGGSDYFVKLVCSTTTAFPTSPSDWATTILVKATGGPAVVEQIEGVFGAIAMDSLDTIHFAYIDEVNQDLRYSSCSTLSKIDDPDSWSPPITVNDDLVIDIMQVAIEVDSNNVPHIAWNDRDSGNNRDGGLIRDVFYTKANTSGGFYPDIKIADGISRPGKMYASISIDRSDTVHIAWQDAAENAFCYLKSRDAAATTPALSTWKNSTYDSTTPDNVFTTDAAKGGTIKGCSLIVDIYDNVLLGGTTFAGGEINVYKCPAGDSPWELSLRIESTYDHQVQLGAAGQGEVHMVGRNSTTNDVIYRKYTVSSGWDNSDTTIQAGTYDWPCIEKRIRPDDTDHIGLVWGDDANNDIYWSTKPATPINRTPAAPDALTQHENINDGRYMFRFSQIRTTHDISNCPNLKKYSNFS